MDTLDSIYQRRAVKHYDPSGGQGHEGSLAETGSAPVRGSGPGKRLLTRRQPTERARHLARHETPREQRHGIRAHRRAAICDRSRLRDFRRPRSTLPSKQRGFREARPFLCTKVRGSRGVLSHCQNRLRGCRHGPSATWMLRCGNRQVVPGHRVRLRGNRRVFPNTQRRLRGFDPALVQHSRTHWDRVS